MRYLNYFLKNVRMILSSEMQYKANFIIRIITLSSFDIIMPIIGLLIYVRSNGFYGWSLYEFLLFQGVFMMVTGIDRLFFQKVDWSLSEMVLNGTLDRDLLYPIDTLSYISFKNLNLEQIVNTLLGISVIIYSIVKLDITVTPKNLILFLMFIFFAIVLIFSLAMLRFGIIVRAIMIGRIGELFRISKSYAQYPVDIFSSFFSSAFRYLIPLAIIAHYPSSALLGKTVENFHYVLLSIVIILIITRYFWLKTLKYYESSGG